MINSMGSCFNALSVSSLPLIVVLLFLTAGLQNGPNHIAALISQEEWDIHNVAKRMDIELCVDHFDSHADTIIKTKESIQMGAKFIADAELGSHDQCLRLCCETDNCDVFIFEEHAHGSCFLFECGRPSDFRCKFIPHANYTSGILDMSRRIATPVTTHSPIQPAPVPVLPTAKPHNVLSEHEMDLDKLRVKTSRKKGITTTTTLIPPLGVRIADITTKAVPAAPKVVSKCSRFQFQCRNGEECIAIYDVCNGIPQCKDGSDEGKECPTTAAGPVGAKPDMQQAPETSSYNLPIPLVKVPLQKNYQNDGTGLDDGAPKGLMPETQMLIPRNREDPMSAPNLWPQRQQVNVDGPYNGIEGESHIFNHKNGLQLPATNINSQYSDHMRDYSAIPHDPYLTAGELYQQQQQQQAAQQQIPPQQIPPSWFTDQRSQNRYGWQQAAPLLPQQDLSQQKSYGQQPLLPPQQQQQQNWPPAPPPPPPQPQQPMLPAQSEQQSSVDELKAAVPDSSGGKSDSTSEEDEEESDDQPTPEPTKKSHKKKKQKSHRHEHESDPSSDKVYTAQYKMIRSQLDMEFPDHDGMSDRPSGAVLSLILGVIIAAALAILVGCRVRVAGRRLRRHLPKGSGNYEADFLVNGMYL